MPLAQKVFSVDVVQSVVSSRVPARRMHMAEYHAHVAWKRGDSRFTDNRYSRAHEWRFDEGIVVAASSSPHVVPLPLSAAAAVDPEEAFVASLSSCHMLTFLSLAAKRGFCIDRYDDAASGLMEKNAEGKYAMTRVTLRDRKSVVQGKSLTS